jgi:hypothetical protein
LLAGVGVHQLPDQAGGQWNLEVAECPADRLEAREVQVL